MALDELEEQQKRADKRALDRISARRRMPKGTTPTEAAPRSAAPKNVATPKSAAPTKAPPKKAALKKAAPKKSAPTKAPQAKTAPTKSAQALTNAAPTKSALALTKSAQTKAAGAQTKDAPKKAAFRPSIPEISATRRKVPTIAPKIALKVEAQKVEAVEAIAPVEAEAAAPVEAAPPIEAAPLEVAPVVSEPVVPVDTETATQGLATKPKDATMRTIAEAKAAGFFRKVGTIPGMGVNRYPRVEENVVNPWHDYKRAAPLPLDKIEAVRAAAAEARRAAGVPRTQGFSADELDFFTAGEALATIKQETFDEEEEEEKRRWWQRLPAPGLGRR